MQALGELVWWWFVCVCVCVCVCVLCEDMCMCMCMGVCVCVHVLLIRYLWQSLLNTEDMNSKNLMKLLFCGCTDGMHK